MTDQKILNGPIFIIGSKRSGTTWLLWLLSSLPEVVGILQSDFINQLSQFRKWWTVAGRYHKQITGISGEAKSQSLIAVLGDDYDLTLTELANRMYSQVMASKESAKFVVESQPEYIEDIDLIRSLFSRPIFLHAIRDPRDVFASWKHASSVWSTTSVFANDPIRFSDHWKRDQEIAAKLARIEEAEYVQVTYEDLVNDTAPTLQELCDQLGIITSAESIEASVIQNEISRIKDHANMPSGFFRKGVAQGWKNDLRRAEIAALEFSLGDQLDAYGYQRSLPERDKLPLSIKARGLFGTALKSFRKGRFVRYLKSFG